MLPICYGESSGSPARAGVELYASLLLFASFTLVGEELMQPYHSAVGDQYVTGSVEICIDSVRDGDPDEIAEVLYERWRQPLIESSRGIVSSAVGL